MRYVIAGYVIIFSILFLYTVQLAWRRRRLALTVARVAAAAPAPLPPGPGGRTGP
jgi:hypothetical protein